MIVSGSGVPRNFVQREGWGVQDFQLRTDDREDGGSGGGSPLVRGSGSSCYLVQEMSFKIFLIFGALRLFKMTTNLFVITNVNNCEPR